MRMNRFLVLGMTRECRCVAHTNEKFFSKSYICMYLMQVNLTKSLFRNVKVLNIFDKILNLFSKQDLFHRASRVDRFSLGYIAILDEYRVAANYHKSQRTIVCRSELGRIDVRRLIFLVRSASAVSSSVRGIQLELL